jgi:hypothetical protein
VREAQSAEQIEARLNHLGDGRIHRQTFCHAATLAKCKLSAPPNCLPY